MSNTTTCRNPTSGRSRQNVRTTIEYESSNPNHSCERRVLTMCRTRIGGITRPRRSCVASHAGMRRCRRLVARILIVDDNATVRRFLEVAMNRAGHETRLATDGEDALRLYDEAAPELVILDIFMPRKDGIQTILELRRRAPRLPIIAL